jgi:hypothetical protein
MQSTQKNKNYASKKAPNFAHQDALPDSLFDLNVY